jgi:hypothetical protein
LGSKEEPQEETPQAPLGEPTAAAAAAEDREKEGPPEEKPGLLKKKEEGAWWRSPLDNRDKRKGLGLELAKIDKNFHVPLEKRTVDPALPADKRYVQLHEFWRVEHGELREAVEGGNTVRAEYFLGLALERLRGMVGLLEEPDRAQELEKLVQAYERAARKGLLSGVNPGSVLPALDHRERAIQRRFAPRVVGNFFAE